MEDVHAIFTEFKREFPGVHEASERLGHEVHEAGGPLPEATRWLLKVAISAAAGHPRALETHLRRAREAAVTDEEVRHALLLLIPTCGFPAFMEAYGVARSLPPR
ncbi:MAG: carboxymuconolactone decarboxylase family protein [Deferrisomatales bacterium]